MGLWVKVWFVFVIVWKFVTVEDFIARFAYGMFVIKEIADDSN